MAYWVLLVIISLAMSLAAFVWGLRAGQFADPERARYLAISERSLAPPVADPGRITREVYALVALRPHGAGHSGRGGRPGAASRRRLTCATSP